MRLATQVQKETTNHLRRQGKKTPNDKTKENSDKQEKNQNKMLRYKKRNNHVKKLTKRLTQEKH